MTLINTILKKNTFRWFFLGIGIVAVLALTTLNIYSLYALRESTIEVAKDNKKNQLEEFSNQIRYRFLSPFRDIRNLSMQQLDNSWNFSGNFPEQFKTVLTQALNDSIFREIHYMPNDTDGCNNPDEPIYKFEPEAGLFTVTNATPKAVCDGFGISRSQIEVTLDDYRWNNKVTFDAHRSMTLALFNLENRSVVGHLNFTIDRDYLINGVLNTELKKQFGTADQSGLVVWLRDWMQNDILAVSDEQYVYNRDVYEIDIRQRFPDMLDNWVFHAAFFKSPAVAASNASFTRNLFVLIFAVVVLFGALVFMFITAQRERDLAERQAGFLANITHELKTPLAVMQAAGENIADGRVTDGSRLRSYGNHIYDESVRLRKMIEKLLDVAKVDAGQSLIEPVPLQVEDTITQIFESNKEYLTSKGFEYELHTDPNLPPVMVDPNHLETILNNLIENAIKYSSDEKFIRINVDQLGRAVAFSVSDKGNGIPKKLHKLIFEKFYRAENALTAKTKGHGLGLSIVKNLVEMNGGTITVDSKVKEGSTFTVVFPIILEKPNTQHSTTNITHTISAQPIDAKDYV